MGSTHGLVNMMSLAEPEQNMVRMKRPKADQNAIVRRNAIDVEKGNANEKQAEMKPNTSALNRKRTHRRSKRRTLIDLHSPPNVHRVFLHVLLGLANGTNVFMGMIPHI